MKFVLTYDSGDGFESSIRIIGFEAESRDKLEYAIREMAQRYEADLPEIEKKVKKIYNNRRLHTHTQDKQVDEVRREPYMLRCGKYQLWAGEFIVYRFNGDNMVNEFVMPEILELEEWFEAVSEKGTGLH